MVAFPNRKMAYIGNTALVLIKVFEKELYISLDDMFTRKVKLKTFLWCFLPVLLYWVGKLILAKYLGINLNVEQLREFSSIQEYAVTFAKNSWYSLVMPAIPEEMVFRVWILNAFLGHATTKKQKVMAIILSNILFAAVHVPYYILACKYSIILILLSCAYVFMVGSAFSIILLKSKNIILPIFIHCLWDGDAFSFTFFN